MKRGRPKKVEDKKDIIQDIPTEKVKFRCEKYPELLIYNLKVRFIQGGYETDNPGIIKSIRESNLPIVEVK